MNVGQPYKTMDDAAGRFLDALIDETDLPFTTDESQEWASAFLESIKKFRELRHSKEAERAAQRLGRQASADTYRFFWEFRGGCFLS